jgi:hypothetical protein
MTKLVLVILLLASPIQAAGWKSIIKPLKKVSTWVVVSSQFDAAATYRAVRRPGMAEGNPLMRPFASNPSIFPVLGLSAVGVNALARLERREGHPKAAHAIQFVVIGLHVVAGVHNVKISGGR